MIVNWRWDYTWIFAFNWMGNVTWKLSCVKKDVFISSEAGGRWICSRFRHWLIKCRASVVLKWIRISSLWSEKESFWPYQSGKVFLSPLKFWLWILSPLNIGFFEISCRCRYDRGPVRRSLSSYVEQCLCDVDQLSRVLNNPWLTTGFNCTIPTSFYLSTEWWGTIDRCQTLQETEGHRSSSRRRGIRLPKYPPLWKQMPLLCIPDISNAFTKQTFHPLDVLFCNNPSS